MRKTKGKNYKERGITLLALVVTIIVLLILAGITISLALSNNGVIGRAQYASNTWANATKNEKSLFDNIDNNIDAVRNVNDIGPDNYGDEFEYGIFVDNRANGYNGHIDGWKILYKDSSNNVFSTTSDFVRVDNPALKTALQKSGWTKFADHSTYATKLENHYKNGAMDITDEVASKFMLSWKFKYPTIENETAKAVASLLDTNNWDSFVTEFAKSKGASAIGGVTLEMWYTSWIQKGYNSFYIDCVDPGEFYGCPGYQVGKVPDSTITEISMKQVDSNGANDTLYFPHSEHFVDVWGGRMSSPSTVTGGSLQDVEHINSKRIRSRTANGDNVGIRPVVCLPSSIAIVRDPETGMWKISESDEGMQVLEETEQTPLKNSNGKSIPYSEIKNYYGSYVLNYYGGNEKYQLFYVDKDGKYGEKGRIYLKAQYDDNRVVNLTDNLEETGLRDTNSLFYKLNPDFARVVGESIANSTTIGAKYKAIAYLCDTSKWSKYAVGENVWAIGGPPVEMFCDSYNDRIKPENEYEAKTFFMYNTTYGYMLKPSSSSDEYVPSTAGSLSTDAGKLYDPLAGIYTWFASPSGVGEDYLLKQNVTSIVPYWADNNSHVTPVVSLPANYTIYLN